MLNRPMNLNEPLCTTMNQSDPQMTQNYKNRFTMTQNNVPEPFIFLKFIPKIRFRANLVPKLESALFEMKLDTKGHSRLLILNLKIVF